jgi:carboxy-terminal domain RNA polymerase II polypeptide A small phosphatase
VLDLDETLVHSQFVQIPNPDYVVEVDLEGRKNNIYVLKRPFVDQFLQIMAQHYEVIIYTASLSKYADPLMDMMDPNRFCSARLFREHCAFVQGIFVKDMSVLGRNMKDTILIDNSPTSYMLQPECGLPILSWYDDPNDRVLMDYVPLLIEMARIHDVRDVIPRFVRNHNFDMNHAMNCCQHQLRI